MTAELRFSNPAHRPDKALGDLYDLMNDQSIKLQERIYAARSASRIEPLGLIGDEPPAVVFLRKIISTRIDGKPFSAVFRHQAAAALAYWERRAKQAALKFEVADNTQRITAWRRLINGCIRFHLAQHNRWPQDKHLMIGSDEHFEMPPYDPELALNALLLIPASQTKNRRKAIDQPDAPRITSDLQRLEILTAIAETMHSRLNATAEANESRQATLRRLVSGEDIAVNRSGRYRTRFSAGDRSS
jgi:hypothetical protein